MARPGSICRNTAAHGVSGASSCTMGAWRPSRSSGNLRVGARERAHHLRDARDQAEEELGGRRAREEALVALARPLAGRRRGPRAGRGGAA
eukprot:11307889-Alexandrium_andersonii.AAC.1